MNEYKLTLTVTINELDDPSARKQAQEIAEALNTVVPATDVKLKQVYTDQPPRGVRMG